MSIGRVVAGCGAALLILPGLCFFVLGVAGLGGGTHGADLSFILVGIGCLVGAGYLTTVAFRAREVPLDESPNVVRVKRPTEPESSKEPEPPTGQEPPKTE